MSTNKRGLDEHGVVHYCVGNRVLHTWCAEPQSRTVAQTNIKPTEKKRELVTCLMCLGIRFRQK